MILNKHLTNVCENNEHLTNIYLTYLEHLANVCIESGLLNHVWRKRLCTNV